MGYTAPTTRTTGTLITASMWNTDLVDNVGFLANPPACRVYHNTTQSISDATETTVSFNSERWDTAAMHDTATNNSRITISTAGLYVVTCNLQMATAADYGIIRAHFRLNGTTYIAITDIQQTVAASVAPCVALTTVYKFVANDYVEVRIYQDNTANAARNLLSTANFSPEFAATWIGLG